MEVQVLGGGVMIEEAYLETDPAEVRRQIQQYETGERTDFEVELSVPDDFTGAVMRAMLSIPYGETRTYGALAETVDSAAVAVGQAAGRNPVPIVVPCHRVIAAHGLGGYSAAGGTSLKRQLLEHEGALGSDSARPPP